VEQRECRKRQNRDCAGCQRDERGVRGVRDVLLVRDVLPVRNVLLVRIEYPNTTLQQPCVVFTHC
jgi:hypothetical protein